MAYSTHQLRPSALAAALCLGAVIVALAGACSDIGHPCQTDSDCDSGSLCFEQTCYSRCETDSDCGRADECRVETRAAEDDRETVRICVGDDFGDSNGQNDLCSESGECCTTDDECIEDLDDERAVCGDHARCLIPVQVSHAILISDRTDTDQERVDEGRGADIAHVLVRSEEGQAVGYGTTLAYEPADDTEEGPGDELDGNPRPLDDDGMCVDGSFDDYALALGGRGGQMLVGFDDTDGDPLELTSDMEIVVIEWGDNCGLTDDPDRYEVHLCEGQQLDSEDRMRGIDPGEDCETRVGPDGDSAGRQVLSLEET